MKRTAVLIYGITCYALFFVTFLYSIGWVGGIAVSRTPDTGPSAHPLVALLIDLGLLALFGLQHSVMARPAFKDRLTRWIPQAAERSTYVLASSVALIALFAGWHPIGGTVWDVQSPGPRAAIWALYLLGPLTVLISTFLIDHFDLFGLRQVVLYFRGIPYTHKRFVTPGPYKWIRHPLYVGWFITFWAAPSMTLGHLLLAVGTTVYILIAIVFEERDLDQQLGEEYRQYRARTPMFVPRLGRPVPETPSTPARAQ